MLIRLAIADKNTEYSRRLMAVLEQYEELEVSVYEDMEVFRKDTEVNKRRADILLFDSSVYDGYFDKRQGFVPVVLWDADTVDDRLENYRRVRKYQCIDKIYKQILGIYSEQSSDAWNLNEKTAVTTVAVYSPTGGVGKTTIALTAAAKYAAQGIRTLYLNLENIASDDCYLPMTGARGIAQIAESLGESMNHALKIQSLLLEKTSNFYYMEHFGSPNDLCAMSVEEEQQLIRIFQGAGLFDVIVIDMQSVLDEKAAAVFELADKILLIERADEASEKKQGCFLEQAHIKNAYGRKMLRILNFYTGRESGVQTEIPLIGKVNAVQGTKMQQLIDALAADGNSNFLLQTVYKNHGRVV